MGTVWAQIRGAAVATVDTVVTMRSAYEFAAALIEKYSAAIGDSARERLLADLSGDDEVAAICVVEDAPVSAAEVDELERLSERFAYQVDRDVAAAVIAKRRDRIRKSEIERLAYHEMVEQLYRDFVAQVKDKMFDFEFIVEDLHDVGEPEFAILHGIVAATNQGVAVPLDLLQRAAPLDGDRLLDEYAEEQARLNGGGPR